MAQTGCKTGEQSPSCMWSRRPSSRLQSWPVFFVSSKYFQLWFIMWVGDSILSASLISAPTKNWIILGFEGSIWNFEISIYFTPISRIFFSCWKYILRVSWNNIWCWPRFGFSKEARFSQFNLSRLSTRGHNENFLMSDLKGSANFPIWLYHTKTALFKHEMSQIVYFSKIWKYSSFFQT